MSLWTSAYIGLNCPVPRDLLYGSLAIQLSVNVVICGLVFEQSQPKVMAFCGCSEVTLTFRS